MAPDETTGTGKMFNQRESQVLKSFEISPDSGPRPVIVCFNPFNEYEPKCM